MSLKSHEGPGLSVHPPVVYLVALLIGIGVNYLWPISPVPGWWGFVTGVVLIVLGIAIMPPVVSRFRRAGTPFNPHKPASALITDGPYHYRANTRSPNCPIGYSQEETIRKIWANSLGRVGN